MFLLVPIPIPISIQYDKYQNLATEMYLIEMGGVFCPKSNCGEGLLPEERRVRCRCGVRLHATFVYVVSSEIP